jgi:hypothetical protein
MGQPGNAPTLVDGRRWRDRGVGAVLKRSRPMLASPFRQDSLLLDDHGIVVASHEIASQMAARPAVALSISA